MEKMKNQISAIASKITVAGIAGIGTLAVLLSSGCSVASEPQPESEPVSVSEVVAEVSEPVSEIEVTETSEEPREEVSEVVEVELPELPLLDENGEVYVPGMFTEEEVFDAIKKIEDDKSFIFESGKRQEAIAFMILINSPYISKKTYMAVKDRYFASYEDNDIYSFAIHFDGYYKLEYIRNVEQPVNYIPVNYLILDEKQGEAALQIVNYYNSVYGPGASKGSARETMKEFGKYALEYILFTKENIGYNPLCYVLTELDEMQIVRENIEDDDEFCSLCFGYKQVPIDKLGNYDIEITFGDGQPVLFKKHHSAKYIE